MKEVLRLLEAERETERQFVAQAGSEQHFPRGWTAALLMAHIASWRNRLRDSLIQASRGQPVSRPPADIDAFNAVELASSAQISLEEAAARAHRLLADLIDLWATLGDRPFKWFTANTTGEIIMMRVRLAVCACSSGVQPGSRTPIMSGAMSPKTSAMAPTPRMAMGGRVIG